MLCTLSKHCFARSRQPFLVLSMGIPSPPLRTCLVGALAAYKAQVRSVLEYSCIIWFSVSVTHMRRLERLQRLFLMRLVFKTQPTCPLLNYEALLTA